MKKITLFFVLTLLCFAGPSFAKPMSSLAVKMKWQDVVVKNSPIQVVVSVLSHVSSNNVTVKLSLPPGVVLLDGVTEFSMSVVGGKPVENFYTLRLEDKATGKIKVEANLVGENGAKFYAVSELPIQNDGVVNKAAKSAEKENFQRIQRNGEWLRNYQLP